MFCTILKSGYTFKCEVCLRRKPKNRRRFKSIRTELSMEGQYEEEMAGLFLIIITMRFYYVYSVFMKTDEH